MSQISYGSADPLQPRPSLGRRLFARFGTVAILGGVLLVVVAWIGFLIWALLKLTDWL